MRLLLFLPLVAPLALALVLTPTATSISSVHHRRQATSSTPLEPQYTGNEAIAAGTSNAQSNVECPNGDTHGCPDSSNKRGEKKVPMNEAKDIEARGESKEKEKEDDEKDAKWGSWPKRQEGVDPLDTDL